MLIKDEHYRNYYKRPIVIKNRKFAHETARSMQIDSIMEDGLTGDEIAERMQSLEIDEDINSVLAVPYIDHTAGISFLVLATSTADESSVEIHRPEDLFAVRIICRKDNVCDSEFEYLKNLNANDDFDLDQYKELIDSLSGYYVNNGVEALRFIDILDDSRHEDFPDDLEVFFVKDGLQLEKMWVRCEDIYEGNIISAKLLNTPFQDFGIAEGDEIRCFPYKPEGSDEWILICDLNQ